MGKIKPLGSIANLLPLFVSFTTTAGATLGNISRSVKEVDNFVNSDKQNSAKPSLDSYLVRPQHEIENLSKNEPLPLQNSAKPLVTKNENSTIKAKINTREEISKFANTSSNITSVFVSRCKGVGVFGSVW